MRHDNLERTRHKARRRVERTLDDLDYGGGSSPIFQFFLVSGVLALIWGVGAFISGGTSKPVARKKDKDADDAK